jgi:fructose-1,6-bisphosphatase/inositol monophosphatase family enzyme
LAPRARPAVSICKRLSRIKVTRKTNAIDLVAKADRESEREVIRTLSRAFPDHAILGDRC